MASQYGAIVLPWGDGEYRFRLDLSGIEEIEAKCDCSLFDIARRAGARDIRIKEMREVLRFGLIGGGMQPVEAHSKVQRWLDERPLEESRDTVYAVALAGVARVHGDKLTEAAEGETGEPKSPSASTSPASEPVPQSSESTGPA